MRQQAFFAGERFDELLRKGLKVWVFYLAVLFFCRLFFLWWMKEYMGAGTEAAPGAGVTATCFWGTVTGAAGGAGWAAGA